METKLYVGNLPYSTTEDDLRTMFAEAGTVSAVDVIKDRMTGQSKGFAFVQMATQEEAETAIRTLNGKQLGNRELKVSIARPREEGGRGGGGGGYDSRRDNYGRRPGGDRNRGGGSRGY